MFASNNGHCTPTKKKQFASEKKKTPRRKKNDCSAHVQLNLADDVGDGVQLMLIQ